MHEMFFQKIFLYGKALRIKYYKVVVGEKKILNEWSDGLNVRNNLNSKYLILTWLCFSSSALGF